MGFPPQIEQTDVNKPYPYKAMRAPVRGAVLTMYPGTC